MADPRPRPDWPPPQDPVAAKRPPNTVASMALVVGSLALGLLLLSVGTSFVLSIPASGAAFMLARAARRRVEAGLVEPGVVRAATIVAAVGLGLGLVAVIVWTVLAGSGFTPEDLRENLQDRLDRAR